MAILHHYLAASPMSLGMSEQNLVDMITAFLLADLLHFTCLGNRSESGIAELATNWTREECEDVSVCSLTILDCTNL